MSIQLISVKCPECGATLSIEEGRDKAFCTYCGAKILLHNENEYVYRHIDEAEVTTAETDRLIRLKELELKEQELKKEEQLRSLKIKICLIVIGVGILMVVLGELFGKMSGDPNSSWYMCSCAGIVAVPWGFLALAMSFSKGKDKK